MEITKGDWRASHYYPYNVYASDRKRPPTTTPIATMTAPDQVDCEANAQLIASAPKLHQACIHAKGLVASFNRVSDEDWLALLKELHEALGGVNNG